MSYQDRKNLWHVIFDKYKDEHSEQIDFIKTFHPIIFPIVEIEFRDDSRILYHGRTGYSEILDADAKDFNKAFWKTFWILYTNDDQN